MKEGGGVVVMVEGGRCGSDGGGMGGVAVVKEGGEVW